MRATEIESAADAAIRSASTIPVVATSPWTRVLTGAAAVVIVGVAGVLAVAVLRPPSGPAPAVMPGIGEESGVGGVKAVPDWAAPIRSALQRLADDPEDPERLAAVREQVRAAILQGRPIAEFEELQTYATALELDVDLIQLHAEFHADVDRGVG